MKKLIYIIGWPLLFIASQFFMTIIATIIFIAYKSSFFSDDLFLNTIGTSSYVAELSQFLSNYGLIFVIFSFVIFLPILYQKYHNEVPTKSVFISVKDYFLLLLLGFSFGLLYNGILGCINEVWPIANLFDRSPNLFIGLIGSVFIGPVLEEYLFRGIVYHRLQKYYSIMKSLLLTGLIFALCHQTFVQIVYAFVFHFMLIFAYERFSDIKASIMVHMSANLASLLFGFLLHQMTFLPVIAIILSSLMLSISYLLLKRKMEFIKPVE